MPRFYRSPRWKHLLTNRESLAVADLTRLASNRTARFELGGPSYLEGFVRADDARVNTFADDNFPRTGFDPFYSDDPVDFPRLSEGIRFMYSFRREAVEGDDPWVIRHAGIVLELEDEADPDRRMSRFMSMDPWGYLYSRPVRVLSEAPPNALPSNQGAVFGAVSGNDIATNILLRTIETDGSAYIDAGTSWGGTVFWGGTIETTPTFIDPVIFARGTSVAQAWEQLVDTGTIDIVLTPIWDPVNRPGYLAELSIYNSAGGLPADAYTEGYPSFRWDRTGRALINIQRLQEGRERANQIAAFAGGTGAADNYAIPFIGDEGDETAADTGATWEDSSSTLRYGTYFHQETYTRTTHNNRAYRQARQDLWRRRQGLRTWRLTPTPEFSPRPFNDYMPGDFVGFYHSSKLREEQWWLPENFEDQVLSPRCVGFNLAISDDSLETVTALDLSVDVPVQGKIT